MLNPKISSDRGQLRIRFSYQGQRVTLAGYGSQDDKVCLVHCEGVAQQLKQDALLGQLDTTWDKYRPKTITMLKSNVIDIAANYAYEMTKSLKPTSCKRHQEYLAVLKRIKHIAQDGRIVKQLNEVAPPNTTMRVLGFLKAAYAWSLANKLVDANPYDGLTYKAQSPDPKPRPFDESEYDTILNHFRNQTRNGRDYRHYIPLIRFWWLTGCRPSEALKLKWSDIDTQYRFIWFRDSKNNKDRRFPLKTRQGENTELIELLKSLNRDSELVFPSPEGNRIDYHNFLNRAWSKVVKPLYPDSTPYNFRDAFITRNAVNGVPLAVIGAWCDTSESVINRHYADYLKLSDWVPA